MMICRKTLFRRRPPETVSERSFFPFYLFIRGFFFSFFAGPRSTIDVCTARVEDDDDGVALHTNHVITPQYFTRVTTTTRFTVSYGVQVRARASV
jgi:hypothetical protein